MEDGLTATLPSPATFTHSRGHPSQDRLSWTFLIRLDLSSLLLSAAVSLLPRHVIVSPRGNISRCGLVTAALWKKTCCNDSIHANLFNSGRQCSGLVAQPLLPSFFFFSRAAWASRCFRQTCFIAEASLSVKWKGHAINCKLSPLWTFIGCSKCSTLIFWHLSHVLAASEATVTSALPLSLTPHYHQSTAPLMCARSKHPAAVIVFAIQMSSSLPPQDANIQIWKGASVRPTPPPSSGAHCSRSRARRHAQR